MQVPNEKTKYEAFGAYNTPNREHMVEQDLYNVR